MLTRMLMQGLLWAQGTREATAAGPATARLEPA